MSMSWDTRCSDPWTSQSKHDKRSHSWRAGSLAPKNPSLCLDPRLLKNMEMKAQAHLVLHLATVENKMCIYEVLAGCNA